IATVKKILAENFVRPDEAQKVKSKIRELKKYTVIDKITVKLNEKKDRYEAEFSKLGIKDSYIDAEIVKKFEKLLVGGIWCITKVSYFHDEEERSNLPFVVNDIKPIQMPNMDLEEIFNGRRQFSKNEWIDALIRSMGMEPSQLDERQKCHFL